MLQPSIRALWTLKKLKLAKLGAKVKMTIPTLMGTRTRSPAPTILAIQKELVKKTVSSV